MQAGFKECGIYLLDLQHPPNVEEDVFLQETDNEKLQVEKLEQEPEFEKDEASSEYVGDIKLDKF